MPLEFSTFEREGKARRGVLAYVRVSSPDQAERRASLEEQRRKIEAQFEGRLGLKILSWYVDEGLSASRDQEDREQFWAMVARAKTDPAVGIIAVDDESRFFRDKYATAKVKGDLRSAGVAVYTTTRTIDPRTMAGLWQETIEETMAHADNIMRRDATMRGMAGNLRERDPESGWAFKNGGQAPFGWRNKRLHMGNDSRGRPIGRTIWELDESAAKVRRRILLWRLEKGWGYTRIRDELNRLGILPARGKVWSHTTIQNMFREDMIWTAAGYTIWNKHYRKGERPADGPKFKPTEEWVIEPDAHPAIIDKEEAERLIELGKARRGEREYAAHNQKRSTYLLSGNNAQGEPLFVCGRCGARMVGNRVGVRGGSARRYICSTYNRHGADYCVPVRIDADEIESNAIDYIRKNLLTEEAILATIRAANDLIASENPEASPSSRRRARIAEIERQVERAKASILAGADPSEWTATINALRAEQKALEGELEVFDVEEPKAIEPIPEDAAGEILARAKEALNSKNPEKLRHFVRAFLLRAELDHADCLVMAEFAPSWLGDDVLPHLAPLWYPQRGRGVALYRPIPIWRREEPYSPSGLDSPSSSSSKMKRRQQIACAR